MSTETVSSGMKARIVASVIRILTTADTMIPLDRADTIMTAMAGEALILAGIRDRQNDTDMIILILPISVSPGFHAVFVIFHAVSSVL